MYARPMHMQPLARAPPSRAQRCASIFELCTPRDLLVASLLLILLSSPFSSQCFPLSPSTRRRCRNAQSGDDAPSARRVYRRGM